MIIEDLGTLNSFENNKQASKGKFNKINKNGFHLRNIKQSDKHKFLLKKYLDVLGLKNLPTFNNEHSIQETLEKIESKRYKDYMRIPVHERESNYSKKFVVMVGALLSLLPNDPNHERFIKYVRVKDKIDTYEYDLILRNKHHGTVMNEKRIRLTKCVPKSPYSRNISDSFDFLEYKEIREETK